jgi:hypothetical protein
MSPCAAKRRHDEDAIGHDGASEGSVTLAIQLDRFKIPLTGQEIELQQLDYDGGMSQLRIRIRERSRFTTVDVDPVTAAHWGEAMRRWAESHMPSAVTDAEPEAQGAKRDE